MRPKETKNGEKTALADEDFGSRKAITVCATGTSGIIARLN